MNFPQIDTVAFVIAWVAFFTTQFALKGNIALLCAFVVALLFNVAPLASAAFPAVAPFLDVFLNTVLLAVSAAGGYDMIVKVAAKVSAKV